MKIETFKNGKILPKKGQRIIVTIGTNGVPINTPLLMKSTPSSALSDGNTFNAYDEHGRCWNISIRNAEWILEDRSSMLQWLKEQKKMLVNQLEGINSRIEFYEKYESKDEYIADKVDEIIAGKGSTLDIIKAIREAEELPI